MAVLNISNEHISLHLIRLILQENKRPMSGVIWN